MKTEKLNLKSIKNVLSRDEMRKIMAGSGYQYPPGGGQCNLNQACFTGATCGGCSCVPDGHEGFWCA